MSRSQRDQSVQWLLAFVTVMSMPYILGWTFPAMKPDITCSRDSSTPKTFSNPG